MKIFTQHLKALCWTQKAAERSKRMCDSVYNVRCPRRGLHLDAHGGVRVSEFAARLRTARSWTAAGEKKFAKVSQNVAWQHLRAPSADLPRYLTTRPSNLGSLRARVELKIPHVPAAARIRSGTYDHRGWDGMVRKQLSAWCFQKMQHSYNCLWVSIRCWQFISKLVKFREIYINMKKLDSEI